MVSAIISPSRTDTNSIISTALREFRFLDVHAVLLLTRKTTRLIASFFYTTGPCLFGTDETNWRI